MMLNWASLGYLAFLIETCAAVVISILAVKALSIEEFAAYKLAGSIILIGSYVTSCGLDSTLLRFGAELVARKQYTRMGKLLRSVQVIRTTALYLFFCALFYFRAELASFFQFPAALSQALLLVCGVLAVQSAINMNGYTLFSARGSPVDVSVVRIISAVLRVCGIGLVFVISLGVQGMFAALLLAGMTTYVFVMYKNFKWRRSVKSLGTVAEQASDPKFKLRVVRYTLVGYLAVNVNVFRDLSIDQFVIAHYQGAQQVAIYGMAATLVTFAIALNPANLLRGMLTPLVVAKHTLDGALEQLALTFQLLTKAVVVVYIPLATFLVVMGGDIIRLVYSPSLSAAYGPLALLCTFSVLQALTYPFLPLISALEKNWLLLLAGVASIYNLVMDILLVPRWGVLGAAFATGTAGALQLALYWVAFRGVRGLHLRLPIMAVVRTLINLAPSVALALLAKPFLNSLLSLAVASLLCLAAYLVAARTNRCFSENDMSRLRQLVRSKGS